MTCFALPIRQMEKEVTCQRENRLVQGDWMALFSCCDFHSLMNFYFYFLKQLNWQ